MPRDKLHKDIFLKIDIMFYPGYSDTFGYMFPEAMSHGIPIITLDGCSRRELVHNDKGGYVVWGKLSKYGFLVASPTDKEIPDVQTAISMVLTNLLSDEKIRKSMGDYNYNLVKNGQFSLSKRNKALQSIYSEAMK
jgi:glycosyltransferase involved in cell wall biosynthesis